MEVLMAKFIYKEWNFQQAMFDCRRVVCLNESTQVCKSGDDIRPMSLLVHPANMFLPPTFGFRD